MSDLALSRESTQTRLGDPVLKKHPSNYTFTTAGFPLSPQKALHTQVRCKVLRHTIYYQTYFLLLLGNNSASIQGSCFPHLIKGVMKFHLYETNY